MYDAARSAAGLCRSGRRRRNEATARIVAPLAFAPKSFQVPLDGHGLAGRVRSQDFRLPVRG